MKSNFRYLLCAALITGAAPLFPTESMAGSCCGGGSGAALNVPKYARFLVDLSFELEQYDGYWDQDGKHVDDPPGSDLKQYRTTLGAGYRFAPDWQTSISVPYVWNDNSYSGVSSSSDGLGDVTIGIMYDLLDDKSAWRVRDFADLTPAVSLGLSLLVPTGISPYDDENSSFDITGRGFYRLDGTVLIEKTIQPWNASLSFTYGTYFERDVNQEYGKYVEPYRKDLGDRASATGSIGYTHILSTAGNSLAGSLSYTWLNEDDASYNGNRDQNSGFSKQSISGTITYAGTDSDWSARIGWNHSIKEDGWGENFPTTDIYSLGVRYVFM